MTNRSKNHDFRQPAHDARELRTRQYVEPKVFVWIAEARQHAIAVLSLGDEFLTTAVFEGQPPDDLTKYQTLPTAWREPKARGELMGLVHDRVPPEKYVNNCMQYINHAYGRSYHERSEDTGFWSRMATLRAVISVDAGAAFRIQRKGFRFYKEHA